VTALYWLCTVVSLLATWLNIRRSRHCFTLWLATNAVWAQASFSHDLPAKGWLHIAYLGLAAWGLRSWSRERRRVVPEAVP
jgi:nicotinamide mononucleotide transporter